MLKRFWYNTSLTWSLLQHFHDRNYYQWWHKIKDNLYLGALPLSFLKHDQQLHQLGITKVISIVEDFELSVSSDQWKFNYDIINTVYNSVDYHPLSLDTYDKVVDDIHQSLKQGHRVYVHCKGGKGRSALAICAYLMTHDSKLKDLSPQIIHDFVKQQRPCINLNYYQYMSLYDYYNHYQSLLPELRV